MSRTLILRSAAQFDIEEAHDRYEAERPGLGMEFRHAVARTFARIAETPRAYPVVGRGLRRALVKRFPYGVFYALTPATIVVIACFHGSRDQRHLRFRKR